MITVLFLLIPFFLNSFIEQLNLHTIKSAHLKYTTERIPAYSQSCVTMLITTNSLSETFIYMFPVDNLLTSSDRLYLSAGNTACPPVSEVQDKAGVAGLLPGHLS